MQIANFKKTGDALEKASPVFGVLPAKDRNRFFPQPGGLAKGATLSRGAGKISLPAPNPGQNQQRRNQQNQGRRIRDQKADAKPQPGGGASHQVPDGTNRCNRHRVRQLGRDMVDMNTSRAGRGHDGRVRNRRAMIPKHRTRQDSGQSGNG